RVGVLELRFLSRRLLDHADRVNEEEWLVRAEVHDLVADLLEARDRAARNVLDKREVALLPAIAEHVHGPALADPPHEPDQRDVGTPGEALDRGVAEYRDVDAVQIMVPRQPLRGRLLRGRVGRRRSVRVGGLAVRPRVHTAVTR